jgi:hypothetical protein
MSENLAGPESTSPFPDARYSFIVLIGSLLLPFSEGGYTPYPTILKSTRAVYMLFLVSDPSLFDIGSSVDVAKRLSNYAYLSKTGIGDW